MNEEIKNIRDLYEKINSINSSRIFITGHLEPDFDSIASAIGIQTLCTHLGKEAYIVVSDPDISLDPGVKRIKDINRTAHKIITMEEYEALKGPNQTLITVDTNKENLVPFEKTLSDFESIIIIDHHQQDSRTIKNAKEYIDPKISSASEIVAQLLLNNKVKCEKNIYTYLLAGIILDTGRFKKNTTSRTHDVAKRLIDKGADSEYINELFLTDFNDDKKINDLVFNGTIFETYAYSLLQTHNISFTLNRECPTCIYRRDQIAKAADRMLKYRVDAAFVMGFTDERNIQVSARSKGIIDVGKIMSHLGGGGNAQNAGLKINSLSIELLEETIKACIDHGIEVYADVPPELTDNKPFVLQKKIDI